MTFGRPAAIPEAYVKLDLPVDFDEIHLVRRPDPRKHLSVQFYNATMYVCGLSLRVSTNII